MRILPDGLLQSQRRRIPAVICDCVPSSLSGSSVSTWEKHRLSVEVNFPSTKVDQENSWARCKAITAWRRVIGANGDEAVGQRAGEHNSIWAEIARIFVRR